MDRAALLEPIHPEIDPEIDDDEIEYPESDGEPMGESGFHVLATLHLMSALRYALYKRLDYYIIADMFLYYQRGNPKAVKAPDVMVIKGVDASYERKTFKVWEEKAVPSVIFEVTSDSTASEDLKNKYVLYESLGVIEYFIFDPLEDYIPGQVIGYHLINGKYVAIQPNRDGTLTSQELNVLMQPEDHLLRLLDPKDRTPFPGLDEILYEGERLRARFAQESQRAEQESQRAEQESQRAEQESQRAEQESQRAEQESQRADNAEAEVEGLRQIIEELRQRLSSTLGSRE